MDFEVYDYKNESRINVDNKENGFKQLIKSVNAHNKGSVILCFEHTGMYSLPLAILLTERQMPFAMVPGLEIKRSLGIKRGKNDKVDARDISRYAYLRRDEIKTYQLPSDALLKLKSLLNLRDRMVKQKAGYQASIKEMKRFFADKKTRYWSNLKSKYLKNLIGR